ncbi:MAG: hypothetical protein WC246_01140 [Candidatus Paceibacterota bacterium]|jgi:hypothetical protein
MTHSLRKKLFFIFVALFCVIGVGLLYYTLGYRVDFSTWHLQKTGALYIETSLRPVSILLNGQSYQDKSSFIQRGTFISTVLPKRYRLVIGKDGYAPYEKNIIISPGQVTRLLHILMVPLQTATTTYAHIPGNTIIDSNNGTALITHDSTKKIYYGIHLAAPSDITNLSSKIATLTRQPVLSLALYPQENNRLIIQTQTGLSAINLDTSAQTPMIRSSNLLWWGIRNNNAYAISATTTPAGTGAPTSTAALLSVFDLSLAKIAQTYTLITPTSISSADISPSRAALILKDGSLWSYSLTDGTYARIADTVKTAIFSPDGSRLLYQDRDGKTFVYLFDDDIVALNAPRNTTLRIGILEAARVSQFRWMSDQYHILSIYPDKTTIAEITQTEPNNQFVIARTNNSSWYDADAKIFFTVAAGTLTAYNLDF